MRPEAEAIFELDGDDFRDAVIRNAFPLSHDVSRMPEANVARLAEAVRASWPKGGIGSNVEREDKSITFHDPKAAAWLVLAPELDIPLTADQWADIATCGAVFTDVTSWLRKNYTEGAAQLAAASCTTTDARPWADLITAIPGPAPATVIDAAVEHVSESTAENHFDLHMLAAGLVEAERLDALQALSAKDGAFEQLLLPYRAQLGEVGPARTLLQQLKADIEAGKRGELRVDPGPRQGRISEGIGIRAGYSRDDSEWLEGVSSSDLIPELFDALKVGLLIDDEFSSVRNDLVRTIYRIGGEAAVRHYDEIIESSDDSRYKFLRYQRDEIAQQELRSAGQQLAVAVAEHLGVPVLTAVAPPSG